MSGLLAHVICDQRQGRGLDNSSRLLRMDTENRRRAEPATAELRALFDRIRAAGRTNADLGRLLKIDSSQVTRIIRGKRQIQRHEWRAIEEWLGTSLPEGSDDNVALMPGLVPLYGWAGAASEDRLTFADQHLLGAVPRHPNQVNLRGAFALKVNDVSMMPRYEPGEVVYVAPNQWPAREQDCVLVTTDGYGFLKRFVRRAEDHLILHQLNPAKDLPFAHADVAAMHAVVGRG